MTYLYITAAVIFLSLLWLIAQKYMNILVERRIATWQNDLVKRHCDEVENIYRQMRGWRHDYHNHIQTMKACLAQDRKKELSEYLDALDTDLVSVDTVLKTGNVMIDAILNSKISLARSKEISVNAKAVVPENLSIADIDLCVVLGNLLDNAIEACMKQNDKAERFIRIYIGMHKELFYLSITNSVGGDIKKQKSGQKKTFTFPPKTKKDMDWDSSVLTKLLINTTGLLIVRMNPVYLPPRSCYHLRANHSGRTHCCSGSYFRI